MSNSNKGGGSTLTLVLLMISCIMCMSIISSSVGSVMISNAEPPPGSSADLGSSAEPEPTDILSDSMAVEGSSFTVEKEEVEQSTFKLLRNKDYYGVGNLYHYHPESDVPFTERRCLHECSVDPSCKAVIFSKDLDRCWGKAMEDFELPLHSNSNGRLAYVKKDLYEEAVEKYG